MTEAADLAVPPCDPDDEWIGGVLRPRVGPWWLMHGEISQGEGLGREPHRGKRAGLAREELKNELLGVLAA